MNPGYSRESIAANIAELRAAGLTREAATFEALSAARAAYFKRFPLGALPKKLANPETRLLRSDYTADGRPLYTRGETRNRGPESERANVNAYANHPAHA